MKRIILIIGLWGMVLSLGAATYSGRVVDDKGAPIAYATVYPEIAPEWGTATNNDGYFSFEANLTPEMKIVVSFIGYEKQVVPAERLKNDGMSATESLNDGMMIVLKEQPIALEETVVAAKASKQRNKRKQMAELLHAVYVKLEEEFSHDPTRYQVVSDVRMQSEGNTWGMEQMIANIVVLPEAAQEGRDSVQFQGRYCKRFFDARKHALADSILAGNTLERLEQQQPAGAPKNYMRRAVNAVDSGVVVHKTLFGMGNMRYDFEQTMSDTRHWTVSNENEGETVLTHTQKISKYLGCFQMVYQRHYIVDSKTYAVRRFSEHAEVKITIPFGVKLNKEQLEMLNLVNMSEKQIEKFRLRRMRGNIDYNTIYQRRNGKVYLLEKNLVSDTYIVGSKDMEIPLNVMVTQRVTDLQTEGVQALKKQEMTRRVKRHYVEIY